MAARKTSRRPARKPAARRTTRPKTSAARRPARKAQAKRPAPAVERKPAERRSRKPETLRIRAIAPSITADDLAASTKFYTEVLGFLVSERWTDASGALRGVMLKAGACEIGLSQDDWAKGRGRVKGVGMSLWCQTGQDIDELAARIRGAGGKLAGEPATQAWGARSLSMVDPDGIHITIWREE